MRSPSGGRWALLTWKTEDTEAAWAPRRAELQGEREQGGNLHFSAFSKGVLPEDLPPMSWLTSHKVTGSEPGAPPQGSVRPVTGALALSSVPGSESRVAALVAFCVPLTALFTTESDQVHIFRSIQMSSPRDVASIPNRGGGGRWRHGPLEDHSLYFTCVR